MTSAEAGIAPPDDTVSADSSRTRRDSVFTTTDHKVSGRLLLGAALTFLVAGLSVGAVLRAELAGSGYQILGANHEGQLFSAHATIMFFLFLLPALLGAARIVVPLQIGATTSALPRLGTAATWGAIGGGALVLASYLINGGPVAGDALVSPDGLATVKSAGMASELWIAGLALLVVSLIAGWLDVVVTVAYMRAAGLRMSRVPGFAFAALVGGSIVVLTLPAFLAGLLLLWVHLHHGAHFFGSPGFDKVWRTTMWLYGLPALFVPLVVGAGALSDVVVTTARRRPLLWQIQLGLIGAAGIGTLSAWLTDSGDSPANIFLPASSWATMAVYGPLALLGLLWLGTLAAGRARPSVGLLLVAGAETMLIAAAVVGLIGAASDVTAGSQYTSSFIHLAAFAAPLVAVVAIGIHWSPQITGTRWSAAMVGGVAMMVVTGALIAFAPGAAINNAPRLVGDNPDDTGLHAVMLAGTVLLGLGLLAFVIQTLAGMLRSGSVAKLATDTPEGLTLEWLCATPPTEYNFDELPTLGSETPLAEFAGVGR